MKKICVVGLGYVGLPLLHAFSKQYKTVGIDLDKNKVNELLKAHDRTLELTHEQVQEILDNNALLSTDIQDAKDCNIFVVTVPTPIDKHKRPDLTPLEKSSASIATILKKDDIVIYESTVYPGATREVCVPLLEKGSSLVFNKDFFCGYSPERINPGDKEHTVTKILKVTAGSDEKTGKIVDDLYKTIITAGTHLAPSIEVAEAAKVIENSQRDINIAFINELAIIFNKLNINTNDVLDAAGTKWNFLKFKPGLVGGHCIGVDPYYLAHKALEIGYNPEILLAGRRLNDHMGVYVASQIIKLMIKKDKTINNSKVLILGITFKENCPDVRNTRVVDVIDELKSFGCKIDIVDYWADSKEVKEEYGVDLTEEKNIDYDTYDAVVLAVAHDKYKNIKLNNKKQVVYDIKSILKNSDGRL